MAAWCRPSVLRGSVAAASSGPRPVTPLAFSLSPPHGKVPAVWFSAALGRQRLQGGHGREPGADAHRAPPQEPRAMAAGGSLRARGRATGHRVDRLAEVRPRGSACPRRVAGTPCQSHGLARVLRQRWGRAGAPRKSSTKEPSELGHSSLQLPPDSAQGTLSWLLGPRYPLGPARV